MLGVLALANFILYSLFALQIVSVLVYRQAFTITSWITLVFSRIGYINVLPFHTDWKHNANSLFGSLSISCLMTMALTAVNDSWQLKDPKRSINNQSMFCISISFLNFYIKLFILLFLFVDKTLPQFFHFGLTLQQSLDTISMWNFHLKLQ